MPVVERYPTTRPMLRAKPKQPAARTFYEAVMPKWGQSVAQWVFSQPDPASWMAAVILMAGFALIIGIGMLGASGLLSINGIRIVLAHFGFPVSTTDFPSVEWWLIPLVLLFIQTIGRHIPGFRWLWRPSVVYDASTTALTVAVGLLPVVSSVEKAAAMGAVVGLALAISAERVLLGAVYLLVEIIKHLRREA
jgi:hypothetical protein